MSDRLAKRKLHWETLVPFSTNLHEAHGRYVFMFYLIISNYAKETLA